MRNSWTATALKGRAAPIEFGLFGCELSNEELKQMAWWHREKAIPGLAYVRVEGPRHAAAVEECYEAKCQKFPMRRDPETALGRAVGATTCAAFVVVGKFGRPRYRGRPATEVNGNRTHPGLC